MSNQSDEGRQVGIPDEALPPDLVPEEDNPLAEGLPAGEKPHDLLEEGKDADEAPYAPSEGSGTDGETADTPDPERSAEPQEG
jgi:hypothetical protein